MTDNTIPTHGGKRSKAGRKPGPTSTAAQRYAEARATKEAHLAAIRGLEAKQRAGELVPVDLLRDILAAVAAQISAHLDAIPGRIKREAPHLTANDLFLIEREVTAARNLASKIRYNP